MLKLLKKDTVDQQIQAHEIGKAQSVLGMDKLPDKVPAPPGERPRPQPHETTTPTSALQPVAATSDKATKKGTILDYSIQKSEGIISGDDNNRYKFVGAEWRASGAPTRGQRVNFEVVDGRAVDVSYSANRRWCLF